MTRPRPTVLRSLICAGLATAAAAGIPGVRAAAPAAPGSSASPSAAPAPQVFRLIATSEDERGGGPGRGFGRGMGQGGTGGPGSGGGGGGTRGNRGAPGGTGGPGGGGNTGNGNNGNNGGGAPAAPAADPAGAAFLVVAPPDGGKPTRLTVAPELRRRLASLDDDRGELVTLTLSADHQVTAVAKFEGPSELREPNTYVFQGVSDQAVGRKGTAVPVVKLARFGPPVLAVVPRRLLPVVMPGPGGSPSAGAGSSADDPAGGSSAAAAASAGGFKVGDLVQADLIPAVNPAAGDLPTLADICAPRPSWPGDFVRLTVAKDVAGRPTATVALDLDGNPATFALPPAGPAGGGTAAAAAADPAAASPKAAAMLAVAKRLKPNYGVRFAAPAAATRPAGTATAPAADGSSASAAPSAAAVPAAAAPGGPMPLLDLRVDGTVEPTAEKAIRVQSTFVRIDLSEARGRRDGETTDVAYRAAVGRPDDQALARGVARALASDDEIKRLKLTADQVKALTKAADDIERRKDERPTAAEKAQWAAAYKAWFAAPTDAARVKVEQEMLWAAQEVSLRTRADLVAGLYSAKSALDAGQAAQVRELGQGEDDRRGGRGGPPGMGRRGK